LHAIGIITLQDQSAGAVRTGKILPDRLVVRERVLIVGGGEIETTTLPDRLAAQARTGKILPGRKVVRVQVQIDATGGVIPQGQSVVLAQVHAGVAGEDSGETVNAVRGSGPRGFSASLLKMISLRYDPGRFVKERSEQQ
jgi:hypothetical protein